MFFSSLFSFVVGISVFALLACLLVATELPKALVDCHLLVNRWPRVFYCNLRVRVVANSRNLCGSLGLVCAINALVLFGSPFLYPFDALLVPVCCPFGGF